MNPHRAARKYGYKTMLLLAIESSCDETAAAVVRDGRTVCSNVIASQVEQHVVYGGVVPEIASRLHTQAICGVVRLALEQAQTALPELDGIAVTHAPGLIGALLVGVNFAKGLALSAGLPLIPVHHLRAHIAANYLSYPELQPPFLCLVVSGGHSHIVQVDSYTDFRIIGRTRDDASGESLDKAARTLGIPYPGGLNMDRLSQNGNPDAFAFPRPSVDGSPFDFSFSGLKTAAINTINNAKQRGQAIDSADFGASYSYAVADYLCTRTLAAAKELGSQTLALAGGVAANSRLRREMETRCAKLGIRLFLPELRYCGDNAAMVGAQGYYEYAAGHSAGLDLNARASVPIDEPS